MTKLHGLGEEQITMTEFFMAMIPPTATAQEHKVAVRNGKPIFYDPPDVKAAKEKLIANLSKYSLNTPYREGVRLITKWLFPNDGKHKDGEYKISKPDTDNLQKMFKDCMTKLDFWTDDQLVASEICEKFWADIPGIYVRIEEL
jgi:Holliday junction resolvase RusA-like endonuclease